MKPRGPLSDLMGSPDPVKSRGLRVRRLVVAVAAASGIAVLVQADLLSPNAASVPSRAHVGLAPHVGAPAASGTSIVMRVGRDLVRFDQNHSTWLAALPAKLRSDEQLFAVDNAGYPALIFGISDGNLFRVDGRTGQTAASVGVVHKVVGHGPTAGEVVVQVDSGQGVRAVVVEAATSDVVDHNPFPAFRGSGGWIAQGTISALAAPGLVLTRKMANGQEEAAIAWSRPRAPVSDATPSSQLQRLGSRGRLIGVAGDWVLFLRGRCPSPSCVLSVLSFTKDGITSRHVRAPRGWSFMAGQAGGQSREALVTVSNLDDPSVHALARLVTGGDEALLLQGSLGLDPSAGLFAEAGGSVYFVRGRSADERTFARWSPVDAPHLATLSALVRPPRDARIVCICD